MKTALITGGARGIGKECVRRFSRDGEYNVIFLYKNSVDEARELERETGARGIKCDVSSSDDVNAALSGISADVLINNAGIALEQKLITDISEEEWDAVFDTDVKGVFLVTKKLLPYMINKKSGRIINISSIWASEGASCETAYSSAKAAVEGFTKALAKETGLSGVLVNCIAPGAVETDMNAHLEKEDMDEIAQDCAIGKNALPENIAEAVYMIANDKSGFITGQILKVDGGR